MFSFSERVSSHLEYLGFAAAQTVVRALSVALTPAFEMLMVYCSKTS